MCSTTILRGTSNSNSLPKNNLLAKCSEPRTSQIVTSSALMCLVGVSMGNSQDSIGLSKIDGNSSRVDKNVFWLANVSHWKAGIPSWSAEASKEAGISSW